MGLPPDSGGKLEAKALSPRRGPSQEISHAWSGAAWWVFSFNSQRMWSGGPKKVKLFFPFFSGRWKSEEIKVKQSLFCAQRKDKHLLVCGFKRLQSICGWFCLFVLYLNYRKAKVSASLWRKEDVWHYEWMTISRVSVNQTQNNYKVIYRKLRWQTPFTKQRYYTRLLKLSTIGLK